MSTKRMPMVFSIRTQPAPQPAVKPAPQPAVKPAPQQSTSRFTMHDLYKVAKKGCKSCGG